MVCKMKWTNYFSSFFYKIILFQIKEKTKLQKQYLTILMTKIQCVLAPVVVVFAAVSRAFPKYISWPKEDEGRANYPLIREEELGEWNHGSRSI